MGNKATHHKDASSPSSSSQGNGKSTTPADLQCVVCSALLQSPVSLPCCGRAACRRCLQPLTHCPHCRALLPPQDTLSVDPDVQRLCERERERQQSETARASLLRQRSTERECVICLECTTRPGLDCCARAGAASHFTCVDCFAPYVRSLCEHGGRLRDARFALRCAAPQCKSAPWETSAVTACLLSAPGDEHKAALDVFIAALTRAADRALRSENEKDDNESESERERERHTQSSDNAKTRNGQGRDEQRRERDRERDHERDKETERATVRRLVAESLSLRCPSRYCRAVLDPQPDGCCAVRCNDCGVYFCWLCFAMQRSTHDSHAHVRQCASNPQRGEVFLRVDALREAHRRLRVQSVRRALRNAYGDAWRDNACIAQTLRESAALFKGTFVDPQDVLREEDLAERDAELERERERDGEPPVPPRAEPVSLATMALVSLGVAAAAFVVGASSSSLSRGESALSSSPSPSLDLAATERQRERVRVLQHVLLEPLLCYLLYLACRTTMLRDAAWANVELGAKIVLCAVAAFRAPWNALLFCWYFLGFLWRHWLSLSLCAVVARNLFAALLYVCVTLVVDVVCGESEWWAARGCARWAACLALTALLYVRCKRRQRAPDWPVDVNVNVDWNVRIQR